MTLFHKYGGLFCKGVGQLWNTKVGVFGLYFCICILIYIFTWGYCAYGQYLWSPEEGVRSSGVGVGGSCDLTWVLGPRPELRFSDQQVPLTSEPFLHLCIVLFVCLMWNTIEVIFVRNKKTYTHREERSIYICPGCDSQFLGIRELTIFLVLKHN